MNTSKRKVNIFIANGAMRKTLIYTKHYEEWRDKNMKGFTLTAKGKDYFFATDLKNKTKSLAKKIIRSLNGTGDFDIPDNASGIDEILWNLQKAECEIRTLSNGNQYYDIHGDGFGGRGSFVDDGKTIIRTI